MRLPRALMPHKVKVRAAIGYGNGGTVFDPAAPKPPAEYRAYIEDKVRIIRDGSGQEATSTAAVWLDPERNAPELSEVTIWVGTPRERTSHVVAVTTRNHPRTPSHQVIYLA